ncbi:MAG: restriction endonuclease subunit S [Phormidesmis sp.]
MGFAKYEEYKDSGVEWLGEVPRHWIISKFGYLKTVLTDYTANGSFADLKKNVHYLSSPSHARLVRLTDLRKGLKNQDGVWISESAYEYLSKSALHGGEFLLANVGAYAGLFYQMPYNSGLASLAPNMFMAKFDPLKVHPEFISLVAVSKSTHEQLKLLATSSSAQPKLNKDDFKSVVVVVPPLSEQTQIALFLDHETSRIDALIAEQARLIALLKEKRQAVISHAVTKGCDPSVPMKDSGVEWLGEIPEHWGVKRLKFLVFDIEGGASPQCHSYSPREGEWGVLKSGCVNGGVFNAQESKTLPKEISPTLELKVSKGDVLMSRASGSINLIGSVAIVEAQPRANLLLSDKTFRLKLRPEIIDSHFFVTVMGTSLVRLQIRQAISGAEGLANNIAQSNIKEFTLPYPPINEQKQIIHAIGRQIDRIQNLSNTSGKTLTLLKERRSALISAAVTGKIDVRNWQPPADTPSTTASAIAHH